MDRGAHKRSRMRNGLALLLMVAAALAAARSQAAQADAFQQEVAATRGR